MPKLTAAILLAIFLLTACSPARTQPSAVAAVTPQATVTAIPPRPTAAPSPTATATPVPVVIGAENFEKMEEISNSSLDQSLFVGFETAKKDFFKDKANIPERDVKSASFESYRWLENGNLAGLLVYFPLECGTKHYGNITERNCSYNRYYLSMIDLTQRTTLWKQYLPINMAGPELEQLVGKLGIKNFKLTPLFTNHGNPTNEWSQDSRHIIIPIQVVNSTLVKDIQTGEITYIYPWGASASWIAATSPDLSKFALISGGPIGGTDSLKILDMASGKVESQFSISGLATDLAWSKDGSKIAVGAQNGFLAVFEPGKKSTILLKERRFDLEDRYRGGVARLKFSDDGSKIAFTEMMYVKGTEPAGRLAIYDLETKKEVNTFSADFYQNGEIIWDKGGAFAATITDFSDCRIVLLNADGAVEYPLATPENAADYTPKTFTSLLSFNTDQTSLTVVRSLFNQAQISIYAVRK